MLLMYGKATVDTKGLPRISVVNSHGNSDGTVYTVARLESATRAAVEKWAKRLGVAVTEAPGYRADERRIIAEAESDGSQLHVYTYLPIAPADSDPAEFPWRVYAQPQDGERWIVNAFTTRERAERFVQRHPDQYGPLSIEDATAPLHWRSRGLRTTTSCQGEPLTAEAFAASEAEVTCLGCRALLPEETTAQQQEVTHHAVMRHGIGGPACGMARVWEPMTRAWKDVTCPDCLASLNVESGGAS